MNSKTVIGILSAIAAAFILVFPMDPTKPVDPGIDDKVHTTFVGYERLWRKLAVEAADKLDSKEFTTDKQVWDFLASGQGSIRKIVFEPIAKGEQEVLGDGKWSPELHSGILRSYSGE